MDVSNEDKRDVENLTAREQCIREIRILNRVAGHKYIIELHQVFENNKNMFFVFELCHNGELYTHIYQTNPITEREALRVMRTNSTCR